MNEMNCMAARNAACGQNKHVYMFNVQRAAFETQDSKWQTDVLGESSKYYHIFLNCSSSRAKNEPNDADECVYTGDLTAQLE